MSDKDSSAPPVRKTLPTRRVVLLASAAVIGIAAIAFGPTAYRRFDVGNWGWSAHAAESAQQQPGFADLVSKVKPAVISVRVRISEPDSTTGMGHDNGLRLQPGSPLEKFFEQFGFPNGPNIAPREREIITGEGSGFFISPDGYAVTNYHVVDHAKSVQVTTDHGKIYTAKVVGTDPRTDLALIKIDGDDLPYVKFAQHTPRIGDWVVAVGNPFGLGNTVTAGIVSARGRDIGSSPYDDFIQIDAPINKGNSGGPAFDVNGNVIGVNTAIVSPSGGSVGIGFDIPADTVKAVVAQLMDKGYVTRGWIGVQIQPVTADIADSIGMKKAEGALVDQPQPNSPAAKAGIKSGDVISAVNGTPVKNTRELVKTIGAMAPGTAVKLAVLRNDRERTITLTLGQLPNVKQAQAAPEEGETPTTPVPRLGLSLAPAKTVAGAGNQGVVVTAVTPDSPAAEHGVQAGDVILDVGGKTVATPDAVRQELAALQKDGKHFALMQIKSGSETRFITMPLGRA